MKKITVYKVVRLDSGVEFFSAFVSPYCCQYKLGGIITNKKMPLFAFDTYENAEDYALDWHVILKCEAVLSPKQPKRGADACFNEFNLFWKQVWGKKKITVRTCEKPDGTVFCSSITPLEIN